MPEPLIEDPRYRSAMDRLEAARKISSGGSEYWMARDINALLGYHTWREFMAVIDRASASLRNNGLEPSHHIVRTHKMMGVGKGAQREGLDYFLSRAACRLIAMNGDPSKPEIAACQAYFVVQTHFREQEGKLAEDEKRLELREKVAQSHRLVSGVAQEAGVPNAKQGVFHDARYRGLYGMPLKDIRKRKGLGDKEQLYDRAGPMELSANDFQMNVAAEAIKKERITGEFAAIQRNKSVAEDVRRVMREQGVTPPENLPLEEPIKEVKKRVKQQKMIPKSPSA